MTILTWTIFGILVLLTVLWVVLVRRDIESYVRSQIKVLGEGNRLHVEAEKTGLFFGLYVLVLAVILLVFFFSFLFML